MRRCAGWGSRSPDDGSCYTPQLMDLDVPETTFTCPDLTTFLGLDALGLTAAGQFLTPARAIVELHVPAGFENPFCRSCGAQGEACGTVVRRLAHVPVGWRLTQLLVRAGASPAPTAGACGCRTTRLLPSRGRVLPTQRLNGTAGPWS